MRNAMGLVVLLSAALAFAEPWDVPPPPRGQWVVDRTGKVSGATLAQLNQLAAALDATGAGQLGVLVNNTSDGVNPRDYATGVFNNWGVGHHGANDGILLYFAVSDRKSEIILGDGSKVRSSQTDVVMRDDVVANMKRGDLDGALVKAARSLDALMRTAAGKAAAPHHNDNTGLGPDRYVTPVKEAPRVDQALLPYAQGERPFPERSPRTWVVDLSEVLTASQRAQLDVAASDVYASDKGSIFFLVIDGKADYPTLADLTQKLVNQVKPLSKLPLAVIALDVNGPFVKIALPGERVRDAWEHQQVQEAEQRLQGKAPLDRVAALIDAQRFAQGVLERGIPSRPMGEVLSAGMRRYRGQLQFGGAGFLVVGGLLLRRWNRKRVRVCKGCSNPRQLLGDVEEDAHLSSSQRKEEEIKSVDYDVWWCGRCDDVLVLRYGAFFSGYSSCPGCKAKTRTSTTTTISHATEWSTGLQQIDERCANCSYTNSYTRTTARLSSSSDSSSSSSSSSSSFDGGSSSGGGSSGSW